MSSKCSQRCELDVNNSISMMVSGRRPRSMPPRALLYPFWNEYDHKRYMVGCVKNSGIDLLGRFGTGDEGFPRIRIN